MVLARPCHPDAPDRGSGKRRASRRAGADRARFASGHALELALHPDDPRILGAGAHDARRATASPAKDSEGGGRTRGERARVRAFFHARGFDSMPARDKSRRVRGVADAPDAAATLGLGQGPRGAQVGAGSDGERHGSRYVHSLARQALRRPARARSRERTSRPKRTRVVRHVELAGKRAKLRQLCHPVVRTGSRTLKSPVTRSEEKKKTRSSVRPIFARGGWARGAAREDVVAGWYYTCVHDSAPETRVERAPVPPPRVPLVRSFASEADARPSKSIAIRSAKKRKRFGARTASGQRFASTARTRGRRRALGNRKIEHFGWVAFVLAPSPSCPPPPSGSPWRPSLAPSLSSRTRTRACSRACGSRRRCTRTGT